MRQARRTPALWITLSLLLHCGFQRGRGPTTAFAFPVSGVTTHVDTRPCSSVASDGGCLPRSAPGGGQHQAINRARSLTVRSSAAMPFGDGTPAHGLYGSTTDDAIRSAVVDTTDMGEIGRVTRVKVLPEAWTDERCDLFLDEMRESIRAEATLGYYSAWVDLRNFKLPGPRESLRGVKKLVRGLDEVAEPIDTRIHSVAILVDPPTSIPSRLLRSCVETVMKLGAPPMSPEIFDGACSEANARQFLHDRVRLLEAGELHLKPSSGGVDVDSESDRGVDDVEMGPRIGESEVPVALEKAHQQALSALKQAHRHALQKPGIGLVDVLAMELAHESALAALKTATARVQALITGESSAEPGRSETSMPTASKDLVEEAAKTPESTMDSSGEATGATGAVARTPPWPSVAFSLLPSTASKNTEESTPTSGQQSRLSRRLSYQQHQQRRRWRLGGAM